MTRSNRRRDLLILSALVLLLRLPFIDQAVQGDDVYYLLFAENAQVDPLHPLQMSFRLQGETVWAAGHTRPPGNAYVLAALIALFGEAREVPFHLAYLLFSLVAVFSTYSLAGRFTDRPLWAALLAAAAPAFVVNGNKLEADLPLLACWTLGFALFVHNRFASASAALAAAGLTAYQSVFATPVLALLAWERFRSRPAAWLAVLAAPLALAAWQLSERAAAGTAPAAVLAGYFQTYDLYALERKLDSTAALLGHLGLAASPLLVFAGWGPRRRVALGVGGLFGLTAALLLTAYSPAERSLYALCAAAGVALLVALVADLRRDEERFPAAWALLFFAGAIAAFYAGSARYLLPLVPAVAIWTARRVRSRELLGAAVGVNLALGVAMAKAEYDYAGRCREVAEEAGAAAGSRRIWTNAEWGLRYYLGRFGGEPLPRDQTVPAGAVVAVSELAAQIPYSVEGSRRELMRREISSGAVPLRLIGPGSRSGYSSSQFGVLPFGLGGGPIDALAVYEVGLPDPDAAYLAMDGPEAERHLLAGFFPSDGAAWRWMGTEGAALLRVPAEGAREFELDFHIPESAPARRVRVLIDGETIADETYETTGGFILRAPVEVEPGAAVRVVVRAEPSHRPPGDGRELAIVVNAFGLR